MSNKSGVKLLGTIDDELPLPPLKLRLSRFSESASKAIVDAGGECVAVYHNRLSLRQEIWPEKFKERVREARPVRRTDIEYYSDPKKYGYLALEGPDATPSGPILDATA